VTKREAEKVMSLTTLHLADPAKVIVRVSLGTVAGVVSFQDSDEGNALMLLITSPYDSNVELVSCFGERCTGRRGRQRKRFPLPMHGIPHMFAQDGDKCRAWIDVSCLPPMTGLVQLYVTDQSGHAWPVQNLDRLLEIAALLK
jgi:hypothetical protein